MMFEDWLTAERIEELACPACGHFSLARVQEVWDAREKDIHTLYQVIECLNDQVAMLQGRPINKLKEKQNERQN
jgi:hypothetical protein